MSHRFEELDVLIWLPGESDQVLAGHVLSDAASTSFIYDRAYLSRPGAISIFRDLEMNAHRLYPGESHTLAPSLRDALPDRWGRRAIAAGLGSPVGGPPPEVELDEITVMLRSGADRIGALDFRRSEQNTATDVAEAVSLEDFMTLADQIEEDRPIAPELRCLIKHCTSVGGARPKALYTDANGKKFIAKFTAEDDSYPVVAAEFIAMRLAAQAGIDVAPVEIMKVGTREILLVERFDRTAHSSGGWTRRAMVSALTWTQENELSAHHISYPQLAGIMEGSFEDALAAQEEMLTRLVFNILVGNSDDHARNHAAFWNGSRLKLTPAYDIAPQRRTSREANQAMVLADGSRSAQIRNAATITSAFGVTGPQFAQIVERLVGTIVDHWSDVCDKACLSRREREAFAGRQFLNDFAFDGYGQTPRLN